jgi:hypothetical protein
MHRLLRERGVLDRACVDVGYRAVLARAASRPERARTSTPPPSPSANGFLDPPSA